MMKKLFAALLALSLMLTGALAMGEITVTKRDMALNRNLDKNVTNVLVILQDGEKTNTFMIASINGKTGRAVMTRVDENMTVNVPEAGDVALCDVFQMGAPKSRGLLVARTINQLLDLNLSTYVMLDLARLPKIVEVVGTLDMNLSAAEAQAMGKAEGAAQLAGEDVLAYVRMKLESDAPARSRGYDALMRLLYQGLKGGDVGNLMGLGKQLLSSMDTNLNVLSAVTMVSAVKGGSDRRELFISPSAQESAEAMRAAFHKEVYE